MDYLVKIDNDAELQNIIDCASLAGGGRVVLEPGIHTTGSLWLRDNVELHIPAGAKLYGYSSWEKYEDFPESELSVAPELSRKFLIGAMHVSNIAITGSGEINGVGPAFYNTNVPEGSFFEKPPHPRPRMLNFFDCKNVKINDINLVDSPGWTCWFVACEYVNISHISICGCQQMINNDGIDIDGCNHVTISDSFFKTGDDCLILRAIRRDLSTPAVCENINIHNCILDSRCQGVRLGCPSDDTIRNCMFNNLIFKGSGTAVLCENPYHYLRKNCTGYLNISDISFNNCIFEAGAYPIRIFCEGAIALQGIKRLKFENIEFQSKYPILLEGNAATVIQDVILRNIRGTIYKESPIIVKYVDNLSIENVRVTAKTGELPEFQRIEGRSWETKF